MRLPPENASYYQRVRFGRHVARRLRHHGRSPLAASIEKATQGMKLAGRAWEDATEPVEDALADREGIDDDLDDAAKLARARLAGRAVDAVHRPPYQLIFAEGIEYFTAAALDEEVARYGELARRIAEHLPEGDDVRGPTLGAIDRGIAAFARAQRELEEARTEAALARTRLEAATDGWVRLMEKAYGTLVAELGRAKAERFFPKVHGLGSEEDEAQEAVEHG